MSDTKSDFRVRQISPWRRGVALLLMPIMALNAPPVLSAAQQAVDSANQPPVPNYPAPVTTPAHVKVNRKLPKFNPAPSGFSLPAQPSDQDIFSHSLFEEPLVPVEGKTTPAENAALGQTLKAFSKRTVRDDYSALEDFLSSHPQSPWRTSLLLDLGGLYRQSGWYTKAMDAWQSVWTNGKTSSDPKAKVYVDRALVELVVLNARVGRMDVLKQLIPVADSRHLTGSSKEKIEAAKQALAAMHDQPETSFRCGPIALEKIRNMLDNNAPSKRKIRSMDSTQQGTSMLQLKKLAHKLGMEYQVAKREPGAAVIAPAVVNWKLGHYAALLGKKGDLWHLQDPTFGTDVWISERALDSEASGYFLIPAGTLAAGWTAVDDKEAGTIWGKGTNQGPEDKNNRTGKKCTCCPHCPPAQIPGQSGGQGTPPAKNMARYSVYQSTTSLSLDDTPLYYQPAFGPSVNFTISYSQREASQPTTFTYSNLGALWSFNWLSYIIDDPGNPGGDVSQYMPGGGTLTFTGYDGTSHAYAPELNSNSVLKLTGTDSYELDFPDGSKEIFSTANTATPRKVFLTQTIDAAGNALTYSYDSDYRIVGVTDATGLVTTVSYASLLSADSGYYRISTVTDPFGRTATLAYTSEGNLASSTDMIGIVSHYNYVAGNLVSLQTPYGTSTFDVGEDGSKRWVQINDPLGGQQRVETWNDYSPGTIPASVSQYPSDVDNNYLNLRNSFFWDREAMMECGNTLDYTKAQITHFLHTPDYTFMSATVESEKAPLESRVYYLYAGQANSIVEGTNTAPTEVERILANGDTQKTSITNNSQGLPTQVIDPAGRTTNYTYDTNNIDLTQVSQVNGSGSDILMSATYNSQHEPLTVTDASGQVTTYTYYTNGQLHTVTNAKGETTTCAYNSGGQLTSVTGPVSGATISFTYDDYGRVRTATDLNGYALTYDYDNLDRVTKVTYPDGTYDQNTYTNLDLTLQKDRLGRVARYLHNALEQLTGTVDPQGRVTTYERCTCGALIGLIDALGHRTSWVYDLEGRVSSKTYADGSQYTYTYDTGYTSRLVSSTDPKSQTTSYTYNDDDSLNQATLSDSTIAYTYDTVYSRVTGVTKTVTATSASYATAYTYNSVYSSGSPITGGGLLHTEMGPLGSTAAITYSYDELGRMTGISINGTGSTLSYDSLNRVVSESNLLATFTYSYYGVTPRLHTVINDQNGLNTHFHYQTSSTGDFRLTDITNHSTGTTVLSKFDYTYNAEDDITTWQEQADSNTPTLWTYGYDKADQLISATKTDTSTSAVLDQYVYGYDAAGNRTNNQHGLRVVQASFNDLNQTVGASEGGPLQFTGTLSKAGTVTVGGNPAMMDSKFENFSGSASVTSGTNNVPVVATSVNGYATTNSYQVVVPYGGSVSPTYDANGNETSNGHGQTYTWDAQNELTAITYTSGANSGNHTEFTYDAEGRRIAIIEKSGVTIGSGTVTSTKQFVWIGGRLAEERDASNSVTKRFYAQGERINGINYYYTRDHLGAIRELTNSSDATVARYDYDPYGRVITIVAAVSSDFEYSGDYEHATSGLNLTMFRAYDPDAARWLSRDLLGEGVDSTLYSYVVNNPISFTDPSGLMIAVKTENAPGDFKQKTDAAIDFLSKVPGLEKMINDLRHNPSYTVTITYDPMDPNSDAKAMHTPLPSDSEVPWDPCNNENYEHTQDFENAYARLAHELSHAYDNGHGNPAGNPYTDNDGIDRPAAGEQRAVRAENAAIIATTPVGPPRPDDPGIRKTYRYPVPDPTGKPVGN